MYFIGRTKGCPMVKSTILAAVFILGTTAGCKGGGVPPEKASTTPGKVASRKSALKAPATAPAKNVAKKAKAPGPGSKAVKATVKAPKVLDGIRGGWIDLVLDQQPFLQGYLPIVQICLTEKFQFSGLHIDTGAGFIHKDNVDVLAPLVEQQIR